MPMPPNPMIGKPQYGEELFCGGVVTIWALPRLSHWVVFGPVLVHSGAAAAMGAAEIAAQAPAAAKSVVR